MAKVLNPLSSEDARGKFGPVVVFSGWRTIKTVRTRVSPTNPRTSRQTEVRALLAQLSQAWGSLSTAQAANWNAAATISQLSGAFGKYFQSGFDMFVQTNFLAIDAGGTQSNSPPTGAFVGNVSNLILSTGANAGDLGIAWTPPSGASATDFVDVWLTAALASPNRAPQQSDYRHRVYLAGNDTTATITGLVPSAYYGVRIRYLMEDGRAGLYIAAKGPAHA